MPGRLNSRLVIGLSLLFNSPFVLFGVQRSAFDTYVHIFLADHYRGRWWSLWEPRWYLGFSMASYPPLVHQLIALLSWPASGLVAFFAPAPEPYSGAFRILGEEIAYAALVLLVLSLFPLAVRPFARLFVGPCLADISAVLAIFLPALSLTAWAFGQLPTLSATVVILLALVRGDAFVRGGRRLHLAQAVALAGVAGVTHHGGFLFVPFASGAVVARLAWDEWHVTVGATLPARFRSCLSQAAPRLRRLILWISLSALAVAAALWPFLLWSRGQGLQTPIDHASRHSLLRDPTTSWFFFWPMYGPLLLTIPLAFWMSARSIRRWPLLAACVGLFLLGLGGTTPLPRLLFGSGWEWLTYDRFSFWAALCLLPFASAVVLRVTRRRRWAMGLFLGVLIGWAYFSGWLCIISTSQPPALDLAPLVRLLNDPAQRPYRYLTLGFGDQFARLSALTDNGSPDGDYHTARQLPELRASGLGALDTALWNPKGIPAIVPFLAHPERYGLRWVFVNNERYTPALVMTGWSFRWDVGGVSVWERREVPPLPDVAPLEDRFTARWWGIAPLALLATAAVTFSLTARPWRRSPAQVIRALAGVRRGLWIFTVMVLPLSWGHIVHAGTLPNLYFLYQGVAIFASDIAAALTVVVWFIERRLRAEPVRFGPRPIGYAGLALIGASALSTLSSQDVIVTLALTAHLMLLGGLYLVCVNDAPDPASLGVVFAVWLLIQAGTAWLEVILQNTSWLNNFYWFWPGSMTATDHGASVVQIADGARWLRAYGTWPHPNVLGGIMLIGLGPAIERYLTDGRKVWLVVFVLGVTSLVLSFSRSAWIGGGVALLGIAVGLPRIHWPRTGRLLFVSAATATLMAWLLTPFFLARTTGGQGLPLEQNSIDIRVALLKASVDVIGVRWLSGVGAGTFAETLARLPGQPIWLEPVHNIFLLVTAETGVLGGVSLVALGLAVLIRLGSQRRRMTPFEASWIFAVLGALTVGLLDHYWWTLPSARMLLVIALGLWGKSTLPDDS